MTLSNEALKESLSNQRKELVDEIQSLENSLLVAKEKFLKVQGAIEILDIILGQTGEQTTEVVEPEVEV